MQKITEIIVQNIVKRREIVNGIETFTEKQVTKIQPVGYVDGLPRFGHFLLDRFFFYIFTLVTGLLIGVVLVMLGTSIDADDPTIKIYDTLFSWLILQPAYYFIFEASMQSSPAKIILGRIVVDEYGNKPTLKQILIRSISRPIPFEALSCLSEQGWHDTWSKTIVIRKKDLKELRLLQKINDIQAPESDNELKE